MPEHTTITIALHSYTVSPIGALDMLAAEEHVLRLARRDAMLVMADVLGEQFDPGKLVQAARAITVVSGEEVAAFLSSVRGASWLLARKAKGAAPVDEAACLSYLATCSAADRQLVVGALMPAETPTTAPPDPQPTAATA